MIKTNGIIVSKPKSTDYHDLLVIYTEMVGFNMHVLSAVLAPFGKPEHQKRISFSYLEATTFPSMLAAIPKLALKLGITVLEMLEEIGYPLDKSSETDTQQVLDGVFYAAQHEKQLNSFEIIWTTA